MLLYVYLMMISTHTVVVSVAKKDAWAHKCIIYTTSQVASHNSKTIGSVSTKLAYFSASIYRTLCIYQILKKLPQ